MLTDFRDHNKTYSGMRAEVVNVRGDYFLNICCMLHRLYAKDIS